MINNTDRISLDSINAAFNNYHAIAFIACASFERRSLSVASRIDLERIKTAYIISSDYNEDIVASKDHLLNIFGNKASSYRIDKNDPFSSLSRSYEIINSIIHEKYDSIIIDITTFTHETLLIFIKTLSAKKLLKHTIFLYSSAKEYCPGLPNENKWLSKGCKDARSILGFPGKFSPKYPTALILLVGFEHERASGLIDIVDPDAIYMGCGMTHLDHVTSQNHINPMLFFDEMHKSLLSTRTNVNVFEFSARDVKSSVRAIRKILRETADYNHIIVPMNTKLSTLAAGIVALNDDSIQLCYAEPETYNFNNYSSPDESVLLFRWDEQVNCIDK